MPFSRDTLTELRARILADIATRLPGSHPFQRRTALNVLGTVEAGLVDDQYGYADWVARMAVPFTCQGEYLDGWAALRNVRRRPAAFASGAVSVAGGNPGSVISSGVELSGNGGVLYRVTVGATVADDGTATLSVGAETPGAAGNAIAGAALNFVSPIAGVPGTVTVASITGGSDLETDTALRTRMLAAWANPPQGGDLADFANWALAVPGVTRAWAAGPTIMGAGTVTVYFMLDDASHANGLPSGANGVSQYEPRDWPAVGDQLRVADYLFPLRPVTALVYAAAPLADALNVSLGEVPSDTTIRAGIAAAVNAFLVREATPGGVVLDDGTSGGTVRLSHLEDAIAAVPGLDHFVLVSPSADIVAAQSHIAVPGTITYT